MDNDNTHSSSETSIPKKSLEYTKKTILLILRVLTFVFLLISLFFICINMFSNKDTGYELKFRNVYAYRYLFSAIVIGFAYNFLQMAFIIFDVISGNRALSGYGGYLFDFFGDKIISYLMLSGSAAGFAFTVELDRGDVPTNPFTGKANTSASLLLIGFLLTATASIFTSFALPKKAIII